MPDSGKGSGIPCARQYSLAPSCHAITRRSSGLSTTTSLPSCLIRPSLSRVSAVSGSRPGTQYFFGPLRCCRTSSLYRRVPIQTSAVPVPDVMPPTIATIRKSRHLSRSGDKSRILSGSPAIAPAAWRCSQQCVTPKTRLSSFFAQSCAASFIGKSLLVLA